METSIVGITKFYSKKSIKTLQNWWVEACIYQEKRK